MSDDWWQEQVEECRQDGKEGANKGIYAPFYQDDEREPGDQELNQAYKDGFMEQRKALGDKFEWK